MIILPQKSPLLRSWERMERAKRAYFPFPQAGEGFLKEIYRNRSRAIFSATSMVGKFSCAERTKISIKV